MKTVQKLDPKTRVGSAYLFVFIGIECASDETLGDLLPALKTVAAAFGAQPKNQLEGASTSDECIGWLMSLADLQSELHEALAAELEKLLALHVPKSCALHILNQRLWAVDPEGWVQLLAQLTLHLIDDDGACRALTSVVGAKMADLNWD